MKPITTGVISILFILFFCTNIIGQKNETWVQVKSTELNQDFGYVWMYNNTPDESHKNCKGLTYTLFK